MKEFASKNKNLSTRSYDRKSRNLLRRESGYFPPPVLKIMFLFVSFFGVFDLGFSILRAHLLQAVFEKWRLNVKFRHLKVIRLRQMMPKSIDLYVTTNFPEVFSKQINIIWTRNVFYKTTYVILYRIPLNVALKYSTHVQYLFFHFCEYPFLILSSLTIQLISLRKIFLNLFYLTNLIYIWINLSMSIRSG